MIPNNLYEVRIFDHNGIFHLIPQQVTRIEFHQRLNAPWNHLIEMQMSIDSIDEIEALRSLVDDYIIHIYRTDPTTENRNKVYEGFHSTLVDQVMADGNLMLTMYGYGFTQLLSRRIVIPPSGQIYSFKSGWAESVFKSYVSDAMVSPEDLTRIFPGVLIEEDSREGQYDRRSVRYVNLMTTCENIANAGRLDFGIIEGDTPGTFRVRVVPLWGKDRRKDNTEGNIPTVFSLDRNNMTIPILSTNASEERNFAYVGGEGSEEARIVEPVENSSATGRTPWGRKEAWVEGRQQNDTDGLIDIGWAYLEDNKLQQTLNFDIRPVTGARWLIDWELGDLVTARYFDYQFDKKITQVDVTVTSNESAELFETVKIEMEDVRL